ncbi:MFS general substrate transporter [Rickenella mellea]|uniref:MFS general substrate transporter n=1 Tax=Rickenella mellea TaxID=50990 RepID=A0A4Y7Q650_9AGAM|nr:MFS general substrate transporter [Rickenella mellea]
MSLDMSGPSERNLAALDTGPRHDNAASIELRTLSAEHLQLPANTQAPPAASTISQRNARIQFYALCYCLFLAGFNDGTTGPLLPRIQQNYDVGYTVVSLLFIMVCIGFVLGAVTNVQMTDKLGFGKVIVLGSLAQTIAYAISSPPPPFPVLCLAYLINGWGLALQDALANGYVAGLKVNASEKMGIMHAIYGFGALCSPFLATQFDRMPRWSFHYIVTCGLSLVNTISLAAVFKGRSQEECLRDVGETCTGNEGPAANAQDSKYRQILRQRTVHLLALFALLYVGVEVTIGGWTVTFLMTYRGGGGSSGYVSSGFFGGLTLGRVALLWLNKRIGERRAILAYGFFAICLQLMVWLIPSLIGDAIAVSFIGLLLGPMYPILMNQAAAILPPWLLTACIGWIAGIGTVGSALVPFMTGALSSHFGIRSVQPFLVVAMCCMLAVWSIILRIKPRLD